MSKEPLTDDDGEVRELDADDFASMRPIAEAPPELAPVLPKRRPGQRGPAKKPAKVHVSCGWTRSLSRFTDPRAAAGSASSMMISES
jgi:hypothetical protein